MSSNASVYLNEKTCFPSGCIELFLFNEPKVALKWRIRRELTRKVNLFTDGIGKAMKPTDVRWRIAVDPTIQRHWITKRMRESHRWTRHNRRNYSTTISFFFSPSFLDLTLNIDFVESTDRSGDIRCHTFISPGMPSIDLRQCQWTRTRRRWTSDQRNSTRF